MTTTKQAEFPEPIFIRFVSDNYYKVYDRSRVKFLDLGCGTWGAHSWYLAHKGFCVAALDKYKSVLDSLQQRFIEERFFSNRVEFVEQDIKVLDLPANSFDCVLDHNTLCHVEKPPFNAIHDMLKKDGKLFMVAPSPDTWKPTLWGKGFCLLATELQLRQRLKMFSSVKIGKASYPHRGHDIKSWIVEATR